jgi:hypothetical protein
MLLFFPQRREVMKDSFWKLASLTLLSVLVVLVASWATAQDTSPVPSDGSVVVEGDKRRYILTIGKASAMETDKYFIYDSWHLGQTGDIWMLEDPHKAKSKGCGCRSATANRAGVPARRTPPAGSPGTGAARRPPPVTRLGIGARLRGLRPSAKRRTMPRPPERLRTLSTPTRDAITSTLRPPGPTIAFAEHSSLAGAPRQPQRA